MVKSVNKTLEALLSSVVNKNRTDWDEQLPYLMMALRSAVHNTTGYLPKYLMLSRPTTPLDIVNDMIVQRKSIPQRMKCLTCGPRFKKISQQLKHMNRHAHASTTASLANTSKQRIPPSSRGNSVCHHSFWYCAKAIFNRCQLGC